MPGRGLKTRATARSISGAPLSDEEAALANIAALGKAIAALEAGEKGVAASVLERAHADRLRQLAPHVEMSSEDRATISSFLSQGQGYVPQSQQIIGVLKQMWADRFRRLDPAL